MRIIISALVALVALSFGGAVSAQGDLTRIVAGQKTQGGECVALKPGESVKPGYSPCDVVQKFGIVMANGTCEPLSAVNADTGKGIGNVHRHCWTNS